MRKLQLNGFRITSATYGATLITGNRPRCIHYGKTPGRCYQHGSNRSHRLRKNVIGYPTQKPLALLERIDPCEQQPWRRGT